MAAPESSPRRPTRTPARPRAASSQILDSEPPSKRRRYVPGGPGGGGRWIDEQGNETTGPPPSVRRHRSNMNGDDNDEDMSSPRSSRRPPPSTRPRRDRDRNRDRRPTATPRPRYSSAAAAAAASQASDGYKPREERSWEEFHPNLDIDQGLTLFSADHVDGRNLDTLIIESDVPPPLASFVPMETPIKRKPGRPPKRPESMLSGLGSPPAPRILPLPTHNPKERLNLPKPAYRNVDTFAQYEQQGSNQRNYVDKSMAHVGYQEGDRFDIPKYTLIRHVEGPYDDDSITGLVVKSDKIEEARAPVVFNVEYDMDEQDERWLEMHNAHRKEEQAEPIKPALFEITMTQIEREYYALEKKIPKPNPRHAQITRPRSSSAAAVNGEPSGPADEPDTKCAVCDDGDCENANAIIFCDGCDLAVHQECYGVPFIPEGQWFCRKCKEIGRGTPTCVFCPNVDGAFKQTNTMRWSHLLCALWIPEITIANMTFMEPITDVEKVPQSRWRLKCYLCQQNMGACIQCGNKACYSAFHVTCARRARLFLRMKSTHSGGIDASVLKAFCDKHVPQDWRNEHDVDTAVAETKRYYRHTMKNRKWADSTSTGITVAPVGLPEQTADNADELGYVDDTIVVAANKRKKTQPQKAGWRLPSGAPVVPAVVFNTVDNSLGRFSLRKRKEFVTEACKYWTLKREARKGAALLKRLQLSLESFSPMEITRRNFSGMGAAGRPRLLRRIEFGDILQEDVNRLEELVSSIRQREELSLTDTTEILRSLIDNVYFPIIPLLRPILQRAQKYVQSMSMSWNLLTAYRLDEKSGFFKEGFEELERKLSERQYISVMEFSQDILTVLSSDNTRPGKKVIEINDATETQHQLDEPVDTLEHKALTPEQKELKKIRKRIIKPVRELLEKATSRESELKNIPIPLEENPQWAEFDALLEESGQTNGAVPTTEDGDNISPDTSVSVIADASPNHANSSPDEDIEMLDDDDEDAEGEPDLEANGTAIEARAVPTKGATLKPIQPLSPPNSTSSVANNNIDGVVEHRSQEVAPPAVVSDDPWTRGGVPWYLDLFDIDGTTVHEERWSGRDAVSEELTDLDEEEVAVLCNKPNASVEADDNAKSTRRTSARIKRAEETSTTSNEEENDPAEVQQTEEERAERLKKDKVNAKRKAQRRRNR
jgi:NuA3 HAT complex component NTO1